MLIDRIKNGLASIFGPRNGFDASCFEDPVAERTEWRLLGESGTRLLGEGKPIGRHRSHRVSPDRIELRVTQAGLAKPVVFTSIGAGLLLCGSPACLLFLVPGLWIACRRLPPKVFDRTSGWYWKGWEMPQPSAPETGSRRTWCRLQEIHAIQLLYGHVREYTGYADVGGGYDQYELNLVLHDASRIGVLAQNDIAQMRDDAASIAAFLQVPVWDATRHGTEAD